MASDDTTEHTLKLIDDVTKPAMAAEGALIGFDKAAKAAEEGAKHAGEGMGALGAFLQKVFGEEFNEAREKVENAAKQLGIVGKGLPTGALTTAGAGLLAAGVQLFEFGKELGEEALEAVKEIGEAALDLVEEGYKFAAESADELRNNIFSLGAILGDAGEAGEMIEKLEEMSKSIPAGKEAVIGWAQSLLKAGFQKDEMGNLVGALSDIVAMNGGKASAADSLIGVLKRLQRTHGKLDNRALAPLQEIGILPDSLYHAIALAHGVTDKQAEKMLKSGQINQQESIALILKSIQDKSPEHMLGGLGRQFGLGSVGVQIQKIQDQVKSMFEHVNTESLVATLSKVGKAFEGESGEKIRKTINRLFDDISKVIDRVSGGDDFAVWFDKVADGFEKLAGYAETAGSAIASFFGWCEEHKTTLEVIAFVIGVIAIALAVVVAIIAVAVVAVLAFVAVFSAFAAVVIGAVAAAIYYVVEGIAWMVGQLGQSYSAMYDSGANLVGGLWAGIKNAWGALVSDFHALVDMLPAGVRKILGIASPSKVFAGIGAHITEGLSDGLEVEDVQAQLEAMVMPPTSQAASAAPSIQSMAAGGGGGPIEVNIHVDASGSKDPEATAEAIRRIVVPELLNALEQLSGEG